MAEHKTPKCRLRPGLDFFTGPDGVRVVEPREHLAMQRLEATLVKQQQAAIHFLVRLLDDLKPGFRGVVNKLSRPHRQDRAAIKALRAAERTEKKLTNYGMPWAKPKRGQA